MTTSAQLVEALLARAGLRARMRGAEREPGTFPAGWNAWLAAQRPRRDAVTGDTARHWVELLAARAPARAGRGLDAAGQPRALAWSKREVPREERRLRVFASAVSVLAHVLFAVALLWIGLLRLVPPVPETRGENVVQVEMLGDGTPEDAGGGTHDEVPAATAGAPTQPREAAPVEPAAAAASTPEAPVVESPEAAAPDTPSPPAAQEVVVSAPAPDPDTTFVLPPPAPRDAALPRVEARVPEVATRSIPEPLRTPAPVARPDVALPAPVLQPRAAEVAVREITAPVLAPQAPLRRDVALPSPSREARVPELARRDIPAPARGEAATTATTSRSSAPASTAATAATPRAPGTASTATARAQGTPAASPGAGPRAQPGARPATTRGDDWDDARRSVDGGTRGAPSGVFNPDGSVRLADRPGSASSGLPPGSLEQEIANLDRAGTWLRRPPPDYRGSIFDNAWRPSETLLQEWVRKSVTTVFIPIPGSSKRLECRTVLLAAGGACRIVDPNLNEQPARARPPPDIPFKPHLQEDNGARPPPAS